MDKAQVREILIRQPLLAINIPSFWSADAEELIMGTAAQESNLFNFVKQVSLYYSYIGTEGGFGPFQMEKITFDDLWARLIKGKELEDKIMATCNLCHSPTVIQLMTHLDLAVIMCRVKYLSIEEPLPQASDIPRIAAYWKKYYNTPQGAGTEQEFISNYHRYVK